MEMDAGKLFIGGISWDTSEERLKEFFGTFGEVVEAVIMKDRATGRARGFGFVVFANASVAEKVVREKHVIDGRLVEAKKAVPRDDHQNFNRNNGSILGSPGPSRTKKIFVGGLASSVTDNDIKMYFDQFGTITDVVVMYDHNTQRPRGFGFITYDSEEAVDKVLVKNFHELNGKMVEVKRAVPKELSPGPTRTQSVGYNYGLNNRVSSFLNAHTQGFNSSSPNGYGMRMDGRFSPVTVGRTGYHPYSPSNSNIELLDSGFNLNYGVSGDSDWGYGRGTNSLYNGNSGFGYGSSVRYDMGGVSGNSPFVNSTNRNIWENGSLNSGSNSKALFCSGTGNTGVVGGLGSTREIWGSSPISAQCLGSATLNRGKFGYGSMESDFGNRTGYGRNNGGAVGTSPSYSVVSNAHDVGLGNLHGMDPFFGDHVWHSSSPELEASPSFGYGRGAAADITLDDSVGYVGGYSVIARPNRGIAA